MSTGNEMIVSLSFIGYLVSKLSLTAKITLEVLQSYLLGSPNSPNCALGLLVVSVPRSSAYLYLKAYLSNISQVLRQ